MSVRAFNYARTATHAPNGEPLTAMEKGLLFVLAWHHNGKTSRCDPSISTIARELCATERTVRRLLHELSPPETCTEPDKCDHPHKGEVRTSRRPRGRNNPKPNPTSNAYILAGLEAVEGGHGDTPTPDTRSPLTLTHDQGNPCRTIRASPDTRSGAREHEVEQESGTEKENESLFRSPSRGADGLERLTGWGGQPDETADADAWQDFQQTLARLKGAGIAWGTSRQYMSAIHNRGDPPPITRDDLLGKVVPFVQAIREASGDSGSVTLPDLAFQKAYSETVGGELERNAGYDGQGLQHLARAAERWQRLCAEHPEAADPAWMGDMLRHALGEAVSAEAAVDRYAASPRRLSKDFSAYAAVEAERTEQNQREADPENQRGLERLRSLDLERARLLAEKAGQPFDAQTYRSRVRLLGEPMSEEEYQRQLEELRRTLRDEEDQPVADTDDLPTLTEQVSAHMQELEAREDAAHAAGQRCDNEGCEREQCAPEPVKGR